MTGRRSRSGLVLFLALTAGLSLGAALSLTGATLTSKAPAAQQR
jgi:hypothetical protein